jgi:hypothetical protein
VAPLSSSHPVATSTHHRSTRRRPAWLFFFLLLPGLHSPRPCRVAGPSAAVLAKLSPCAASLPSVRVGPDPPRLTFIRARPNRARSGSCRNLLTPLACRSRSSTRTRAPVPRASSLLQRCHTNPLLLARRHAASFVSVPSGPRTTHASAPRLPREPRPYPHLRPPATCFGPFASARAAPILVPATPRPLPARARSRYCRTLAGSLCLHSRQVTAHSTCSRTPPRRARLLPRALHTNPRHLPRSAHRTPRTSASHQRPRARGLVCPRCLRVSLHASRTLARRLPRTHATGAAPSCARASAQAPRC